jgi:hypothetical protein
MDAGGANRRILARQAAADYRRVEQASIKRRTDLRSPEAKRLFARCFHSLQLNTYFVSEVARAHLSREDVEQVEQTLRKRLDALAAEINEGIDGAQALFAANGITRAGTYDTVALDLEVGVISSLGRRYLEAIQALDRLMPMLRTLEIYEVISAGELDRRRGDYKRAVRNVVNAARELANGLRKRMNEPGAKKTTEDQASDASAGNSPEQEAAAPEDGAESGADASSDESPSAATPVALA